MSKKFWVCCQNAHWESFWTSSNDRIPRIRTLRDRISRGMTVVLPTSVHWFDDVSSIQAEIRWIILLVSTTHFQSTEFFFHALFLVFFRVTYFYLHDIISTYKVLETKVVTIIFFCPFRNTYFQNSGCFQGLYWAYNFYEKNIRT